MAPVSVRVKPGSNRPGVEVAADGVIVRVRAVPEAGRATAEARRLLAAALGVAPSRISLRSGATARLKVFDVHEMSRRDLEMRLKATRRH